MHREIFFYKSVVSKIYRVSLHIKALFKLLNRQRTVKQKALRLLAAVLFKYVELCGSLNALDDTFKPHFLCHRHNVTEHYASHAGAFLVIKRQKAAFPTRPSSASLSRST